MLKKHWAILVCPPHFDMGVQVKIPPGLAALHNFIMDVDPNDIDHCLSGNHDNDHDPNQGIMIEWEFGNLAEGCITNAEKARANRLCDRIAQEMWDSYQSALRNVEGQKLMYNINEWV